MLIAVVRKFIASCFKLLQPSSTCNASFLVPEIAGIESSGALCHSALACERVCGWKDLTIISSHWHTCMGCAGVCCVRVCVWRTPVGKSVRHEMISFISLYNARTEEYRWVNSIIALLGLMAQKMTLIHEWLFYFECWIARFIIDSEIFYFIKSFLRLKRNVFKIHCAFSMMWADSRLYEEEKKHDNK